MRINNLLMSIAFATVASMMHHQWIWGFHDWVGGNQYFQGSDHGVDGLGYDEGSWKFFRFFYFWVYQLKEKFSNFVFYCMQQASIKSNLLFKLDFKFDRNFQKLLVLMKSSALEKLSNSELVTNPKSNINIDFKKVSNDVQRSKIWIQFTIPRILYGASSEASSRDSPVIVPPFISCAPFSIVSII